MAATEEKYVEQLFAITDVEQINNLIIEEYSLEEIVRKTVGRDPERRVCKWCQCGRRQCEYPKIQDTYEFLMFMYRNDIKCKEDPIKWINDFWGLPIVLKQAERFLVFLRRQIISIATSYGEDDIMIEAVQTCLNAQNVDDVLLFYKDERYHLRVAIQAIFDTMYPNNCISAYEREIKYALMCWILVIKGHIKNEDLFIGFRK
jgi:hypothetical protein